MTLPLDRRTGMRASDAEREEIVRLLQAATAEGRLSPEEAGERLAAASAARFRDELSALVADLPSVERPTPEPAARRGARLGLVLHFARFAAVAVLVLTLWGFSGARVFWPAFPLLFMALGLLAHARWVRRGGGYPRRWGSWRAGAWRGPWWMATSRRGG
jgi:hypothetical protein